jgi:hypothetical protein
VAAAAAPPAAADLQARWRGAPLGPLPGGAEVARDRALTTRIGAAASWGEVEGELRGHARAPNKLHVAAALSRLAQLRLPGAPGRAAADAAASGAGLGGAAPTGTVTSNSGGGRDGAAAGRPPPLDDLCEGQQALVDALASRLEGGGWRALGPIELAAVLTALARLDQQLAPHHEEGALAALAAAAAHPSPSRRLRRRVVTCLWALARLSVTPPEGLLRAGVHTCLGIRGGGAAGPAAPNAGPPERLPPEALVALLWALGRWRALLGAGEAQALQAAARGAAAALGPRGLAVTGWAFARLRLRPSVGWAEEWAAAMAAGAGSANGHDVAMALWAAASLREPGDSAASGSSERGSGGSGGNQGRPLSTPAVEAATAGVVRAGAPPEAAATWRPPRQLLDALSHRAAVEAAAGTPAVATAAPHGGGAAASELAVSLWALGRLRFRPRSNDLHALASGVAAVASAGQLAPQGYAMAACALARLRATPSAAWLDGLLGHAYEVLPLFGPREAAGLMMGLGALRHIPSERWMRVWWWDTAGKLPEFGPQELALCLRAAVGLGQAPPAGWLRAWLAHSLALLRARRMGGPALRMALPAFAALERAPGAEWMAEFWRQTGGEAGIASVSRSSSSSSSTGGGGGSNGDGDKGVSSLHSSRGSGAAGVASCDLVSWDAFTCGRVLWALARLGQSPPSSWAAAFLRHTRTLLPCCPPQRVSDMVWALATLELSPPDAWMDACAARLAECGALEGARGSAAERAVARVRGRGEDGRGGAAPGAPGLPPRHLARLLWGLERLDPGGRWVPRDGLVRWQEL